MFKLGSCSDGMWHRHSHPPVYAIGQAGGDRPKLLATAPRSDPAVLSALAGSLTPPLILLYVLHTPRGEGEAGRYQGREMDAAEIRSFLDTFADFLTADSRFDLWVHAPAEGATLVWDRHDLVHGYGPVGPGVEALNGLGFRPGRPEIPMPHEHHYHAACDADARALLVSQAWRHTILHADDEQ